MDDIKEHLLKINKATCDVKMDDIQDVIKIMETIRNKSGCSHEYTEYYQEILVILWNHMETGFAEFDDQLLCSTFFYSILHYSSVREHYLKKVLEILDNELDLKEKGLEVTDSMFNTVSQIYGIFQSSILKQNSELPILAVILEKTFSLLTIMAYEYSQYTFITFKIITFFKKAAGTAFQNVLFNTDHNFKLLNIINHNWENPITGVRSLNKIIFHNLIAIIDESMYELLEKKLNGFYWNKAKFLMLAEIIEYVQSGIKVLIDKYNMVEGLVYSLSKAGLVSAGADMYVSILKKINTQEEWCTIFLPSVIEIVKGSSVKTIENFNNYWCINTLKKFPSLSRTIFDEIKKLDKVDHKLYSSLCIIQQSNRLGLLQKYFSNCNHLEEFVLNIIEYSDVSIRVVSFNILCGLHNKFLPDKTKYDLILDFLKNNVNSDCSTLRINMIKSFQNFLVQLHITFITNNKNNTDHDIENLTTFCKQLQIFIIDSLNCDGNYQRKIATINITKAMLTSLKEIPRKKQKGTRQVQTTLLDVLKMKNQWVLSEKPVIFKFITLLKDPSDDIREQVMDILLNHYSEHLCKNEMMTYLSEEALSCMRSRFFYQITCGQTIFKVILNVILIENCTEGVFKNVENVFDFAYKEIKSGCKSNLDIVKSIVDGKQLHSYLNIIYSIFEVSLAKSYELNISTSVICFLIELLKNISNQFAWAQETSVSSDFSKMNDMVQEIIVNSEHKICDQSNETNLSGLHQIVLNCLWLNVKASCELSSILTRYYKNDSFKDVCEECLKIICNVLETSRHKGAIEAGGTALGLAIQHLTSLPGSCMLSKIPMLLLKRKLEQLVLETNMASVTRRGAGLSIMIHRIVSSDMKKAKPLFHYFMRTLLETYNTLPKYGTESEFDVDNEKDVPQAIYIHFLTKIVTDSSLASDMMHYSDKLARLAFENLSSSCWQIRNAALQLYGALIPKIIGQKKNSGVNDEVIATVAVDEFRTHSPKLWEYIENQLKVAKNLNYDVVQCHNNLVPILNIVANLASFYSFTTEMEYTKQLLPSLTTLLGSPLYIVRRLASKCILNICSIKVILDILLTNTCETENSLNGFLILLSEFNIQYKIKGMEEADILRKKYNNLINGKCSYLSRERFENTFPECINLAETMVVETLSEMYSNRTSPGIFQWANFRIKIYLESVLWERIPQVVNLIADCCNFETYCEILCKRIQAAKIINEEILLELSNSLYLLGFKRKSAIIWRTLYEISLHLQSLDKILNTSMLHQYLLDNEVVYVMRYMIAFAARICTAEKELQYLSTIIFNLSNPETDVDLRLIAATANNEVASKFKHTSDCIKINAIKTAVLLLQDEDEDVRNLSVHFYRKVTLDEIAIHPYICWRKILSVNFLHKTLNNPHSGIQTVCNDLFDILKSLNTHNKDEYNPFASDSKNMYLEPKVLKMVLCDLQATD